MIAGIFHEGSGLGNQLHRYVMTRVLAEDKGYEWGMSGFFKGESFMKIKTSSGILVDPYMPQWHEKKVMENGVDIRGYDPDINFVQDNTVIDGEFQDFRYFGHKLDDIDEWLKVEPIYVPDDVCLIGFRGGEYSIYPDLFLKKDWWNRAIRESAFTKFEVHTDDPFLAKKFFPDYPVIADMATNWRSMRYAKNAIIANSSFYILPRLLSHIGEIWDEDVMTIAPRYWARHNTQIWALPQNYYDKFTYV